MKLRKHDKGIISGYKDTIMGFFNLWYYAVFIAIALSVVVVLLQVSDNKTFMAYADDVVSRYGAVTEDAAAEITAYSEEKYKGKYVVIVDDDVTQEVQKYGDPVRYKIKRSFFGTVPFTLNLDEQIPSRVRTEGINDKLYTYVIQFLDYDGRLHHSYIENRHNVPADSPEYPNDPVRRGYTFTGWDPNVESPVLEDTTYRATYEANKYEVRYHDKSDIKTKTYDKKETDIVTFDEDYTIRGYDTANADQGSHTMRGWYTGKEGTGLRRTNDQLRPWNYTESLDLYAYWQINRYTVTYTDGRSNPANNASSTAGVNTDTVVENLQAPQTVDWGTKVQTPKTPTRVGYTFTGWKRVSGPGHATNPTGEVVTGNTVYEAQWKVKTYTQTVNYQGFGGKDYTQSIQHFNRVVEPTKTVPTGYTFNGWSGSNATGANFDFAKSVVTGNLTLWAKWSANTYTVTYHPNGAPGTTINDTVRFDTNYTTRNATTFKREGYTFKGWATSSAGGVNSTWAPGSSRVWKQTSGQNLYAVWEINKYTVAFNLNGGTSAKPANQTVNWGSKAAAPTNPTRTGYTFAGWSPSINTIIKDNTTFVAQWNINKYTVTFNMNGGAMSSALTQTVNYNSSPANPSGMNRTGYTFAGWKVGSTWVTPNTYKVTGNVTMTAQWNIKQYTATFNTDGGTAIASRTVNHGSTVGSVPNPTKTGHTFTGWSPALNTVMTGNRTFTAQWRVNQYTLTFDRNGGSGGTSSVTRNYGASPGTITPPTRPGYRFTGWSPGVPSTVTKSQTLKAQWAVISTTTKATNANMRFTGLRETSYTYNTTVTVTAYHRGTLIDHAVVSSATRKAGGTGIWSAQANDYFKVVAHGKTVVNKTSMNYDFRSRVSVSSAYWTNTNSQTTGKVGINKTGRMNITSTGQLGAYDTRSSGSGSITP